MELSGLHLLLTYKCNFECDHCFVWGSPWQTGTMTLDRIDHILEQARDVDTMEWIYFEGGEPFLYYPVLVGGVRRAAESGFRVGLVTNGYWATAQEDALEWLRPFAGLIEDLSLSSDGYHGADDAESYTANARTAAQRLEIPTGTIGIAEPEASNAASAKGQIPEGEFAVRFRGRATEKLIGRADLHPSARFTDCPFENLREPGRVHVDPLGNLHVCQGISIGNLFRTPLRRICEEYDPDSHPIVGPLLRGGPIELARCHDVSCAERYADACHLCYETRRALRSLFSDHLTPDQMYGVES
jgi:MoaA/NifB/PqqE/SkfB family radical SAM enzyme